MFGPLLWFGLFAMQPPSLELAAPFNRRFAAANRHRVPDRSSSPPSARRKLEFESTDPPATDFMPPSPTSKEGKEEGECDPPTMPMSSSDAPAAAACSALRSLIVAYPASYGSLGGIPSFTTSSLPFIPKLAHPLPPGSNVLPYVSRIHTF